MSKDGIRVPDYLSHILEAIIRIGRYTENLTEVSFLENEQVQDAVIRNIEIIGEAARNIEQRHRNFADQHPEVPWSDMYLMRNRVSHGYFAVDFEVVWKTIQNDLPELAEQVTVILGDLQRTNPDTL